MRENKWMPRKLATHDGPRTIQQVGYNLYQMNTTMHRKTNYICCLKRKLFQFIFNFW